MDNNKAKLILSVYRPNGADASDPYFAEALKQSERDPHLNTWFTNQQQFDSNMAAALGSMKVPEEGRAITKAMTPVPAHGRRWFWLPMAMAASLAILVTAGLVWRQPTLVSLPAKATIAELATNLAGHHASMGMMTSDLGRAQDWIKSRNGPSIKHLPPGLENMAVLGCQTWNTTRGKVSLVCFVGNSTEVIHLYVFDRAPDRLGAQSLPGIDQPLTAQEGNWSLALWQDDGRTYVLGVPSGEAGIPDVSTYFSA